MKQFGPNDFRHDFAIVDQPLTLNSPAAMTITARLRLPSRLTAPRVTALELTAQHPRQPAPEKSTFGGKQHRPLSFLVQTHLSLTSSPPTSRSANFA